MNDPVRVQRILGGLWGAIVGDALGVPVEFRDRDSARRDPITGMRGFGTHNQPPGTWSDDSSLLLCSVESLLHCRGFDADDMARRFARWEAGELWTPHGRVFDIGIATSQAISRYRTGTPAEEAGGASETSNGNGSLMRILPVALHFAGEEPERLIEYAHRASALTHRHPRSQMACGLYCLLVRELVNGVPRADALRCALESAEQIYDHPPFAGERPHFALLETADLAQRPEADIASSGYVVDTLIAAVWCLLTSNSFSETVLKAVNLGGDTDTTGCVAGGLAGAYYGIEAVPASWKSVVARHDDVAALLAEFISY